MDGCLTFTSGVMGRRKEYFKQLMNETNEREQKVEEVTVMDQEVRTKENEEWKDTRS